MPPSTTVRAYVGSNPAQGRSMIAVTGGVDRADSADSHTGYVGFGYSNSGGTSVRTVNIGELWAVELDPASANVTTPGVKLMVTSDGLHKAFTAGDTGLCAGESHAYPNDIPPGPTRAQTFSITSGGVTRRYCWTLSAPSTVT